MMATSGSSINLGLRRHNRKNKKNFISKPPRRTQKKQKLIPPGEFNDFFMIITTTPYTPKPTKKKTRTNSRTKNVRQKKVDFDLSAIFCRPFFTRIIKSPIWKKLVEKSSNLK